jgi:membrane fusion protein, multidrug efflux system
MGPLPQRPKPPLFASATLILLASATLVACNQAAPQPPAPQAVPVTVRVAAPTSSPVNLEAVGQTEGVREVEVRARVGGILEKRLYTEGAAVKAGQPLFQIDRAPFEIALAQARAQLVEQQARAAQAQREEGRLQGLVGDEAISRKEFDDARSSLAVSKAGVMAAEAAVRDAERNLSYTTVTAPVAGTTSRAVRSEGSLVTVADGLLTTIVQLDPIRLRFSLAQGDLSRFPGGRPGATTKVEMILPDGSTYPQPGKLDFAASRIDPAQGTLELRAEFPNAEGAVLPGQFVRARITATTRQNIFLVPQGAVLQSDQGRSVMLIGPDGNVTPRPVKTAEWVGQEWVVTEGLAAGDKVIVDNLIKLRPGMPVVDKSTLPAAPASPGAAPAEKPKASMESPRSLRSLPPEGAQALLGAARRKA